MGNATPGSKIRILISGLLSLLPFCGFASVSWASQPPSVSKIYHIDDLVIHIATFLNPDEIERFSQVDTRLEALLKLGYLRRVSPHGVLMPDQTWQFYSEALAKDRALQILKYNDLIYAHFYQPSWQTKTRQVVTAGKNSPSYLANFAALNHQSLDTFVQEVERQLSLATLGQSKEERTYHWTQHAFCLLFTIHAYYGVATDLVSQAALAALSSTRRGKKMVEAVMGCASTSIWPLAWFSLGDAAKSANMDLVSDAAWTVVQQASVGIVRNLDGIKDELARSGFQNKIKQGRYAYLLAEKYVLAAFLEKVFGKETSPDGLLALTYMVAWNEVQNVDEDELARHWQDVEKIDFSNLRPGQLMFLQPWLQHSSRLGQVIRDLN